MKTLEYLWKRFVNPHNLSGNRWKIFCNGLKGRIWSKLVTLYNRPVWFLEAFFARYILGNKSAVELKSVECCYLYVDDQEKALLTLGFNRDGTGVFPPNWEKLYNDEGIKYAEFLGNRVISTNMTLEEISKIVVN